jgi:hypothetical protein
LPEFDEFRDDAMVGLSLAHALEQGFTEERRRLLPLTALLQIGHVGEEEEEEEEE